MWDNGLRGQLVPAAVLFLLARMWYNSPNETSGSSEPSKGRNNYAELQIHSPGGAFGNAIQRISKQWALASAQKPDGAVNTMTISWGGLGYLWNQPVAFLFVRPQRYTYEFVESADGFSLCFFPEKYRKELQYWRHHFGPGRG